jgi:hypothetical protein
VSRQPEPTPLERGFRIAYPTGLVLCLAWPLTLQLMLGTAIHPSPEPPSGVIQQLGYTFTGLTFACALFATWRWGRVRAGFKDVPADRQRRILVREILLYSALFELSSLFGLVYYGLGGPQSERYARGFIALTTIMFFVFVPRLQAWREAARPEPGE